MINLLQVPKVLSIDALQLTPQIPVKDLNGQWGGSNDVNGGTNMPR